MRRSVRTGMIASTLPAPGVRGRSMSRKLYVHAPSLTPFTRESMLAPSAMQKGVPASAIFPKSRLEYMNVFPGISSHKNRVWLEALPNGKGATATRSRAAVGTALKVRQPPWLEIEPQSQREGAGGAYVDAVVGAESRIGLLTLGIEARRAVHRAELRVVEHVERLQLEAQDAVFAESDGDLFGHGGIPVVHARTDQDARSFVAEGAHRRHGEAGRVERVGVAWPGGGALGVARQHGARGFRRAGNDVAVGRGEVRCDRRAGLEPADAGKAPPVHERAHGFGHLELGDIIAVRYRQHLITVVD